MAPPATREPEAPHLLHADLDAFYASVEQRDDPSLAGRPVIVGGGVVLAASYEARARGVRTAMNGREARRLCPSAVVVRPRMSAYSEASAAVFEIFRDTTPVVEGLSIDEAFLDVGGLRRLVGEPVGIARELRRRVRDEVGLPLSVGIASTKFLAKVASARSKPDGLLVVPVGSELDFLHPLPVRALWGVGRVTEERLHSRGVHTVGEVAALDEATLSSWLGPAAGRHLHHLAHNRDPRRVTTGVRRKSIGAQRALGTAMRTRAEAEVVLLELTDRVARRLRASNRLARTVVVAWRGHDMARRTISSTLAQPTDTTAVLLGEARSLLRGAWPDIAAAGLSLVGVSAANLVEADAVQLALDLTGHQDVELDAAVDAVRRRFGNASLTRGSLVDHDPIETPVLPDPPP